MSQIATRSHPALMRLSVAPRPMPPQPMAAIFRRRPAILPLNASCGARSTPNAPSESPNAPIPVMNERRVGANCILSIFYSFLSSC